MKLIHTLRFRLSILFCLALTVLVVLVFSTLLNKLLNQAEEEFDERLFGKLDEVREYLIEELREEEDEYSYEEQLSLIRNKLFEETQAKALGEEIYIIMDENQQIQAKITLSDNLYTVNDLHFTMLDDESEIHTVELPGFKTPFRVINAELEEERFIYAVDMEEYLEEIQWLKIYFASAGLFTILIGTALAWVTVGKSMKGIQLVSEAADDFGKGELTRRVDWQGKGSEVEDLVQRFNAMATQMESLIHEMTEVTNNIAHDLRTPVTRMRGLAENALNNGDTQLALTVIEECEHQSAIIEDILNLAQSDAGVLELKQNKVDLNEMIEDLAEIYEPLTEREGFTLKLDLPTDKVIVKLDQSRIQRVLSNLLDNAIKYSDGDAIKISLQQGDSIELRVQDNGSGIPAEFHEKIFKRFFRIDSSRSSLGSGLGLSLARSYVRLHGGELSLESSQEGTSFLIKL